MITQYNVGEATKNNLDEVNARMHVDEGCIVITIAGEYNVPLYRCKTRDHILGWACQLAEKSWIESGDLRYFIELACKENGLERPRAGS